MGKFSPDPVLLDSTKSSRGSDLTIPNFDNPEIADPNGMKRKA